MATQISDRGYLIFKFDLKADYHYIELCPEHRKYWKHSVVIGPLKSRHCHS